jgi:DNA-binding CsgD family transcriptional regulator
VFVQAAIAGLLSRGYTNREIAQALAVSASTVSRYARRLGRRSSSGGPHVRYDWEAIHRFYEAGATVRDCQARFAFSNGAWDSAVSRGAVVPRHDARPQLAHARQAAVASLLDRGLPMSAVARELGIAQSTVSYHARRLGIAPVESARRRYDWAAVQRGYDAGRSVAECRALFGFSAASWHAAVRRGAVVPRPRAMPLDALVAGPRGRTHLKQRLLAAGVMEARCDACGIGAWRGRPLSLALHHVNGDGSDNRLENLQLLCPNCHSQTANFAGRNRGAAAR